MFNHSHIRHFSSVFVSLRDFHSTDNAKFEQAVQMYFYYMSIEIYSSIWLCVIIVPN